MLKKVYAAIPSTIIVCLTLLIAFSTAWAIQTYSNNKVIKKKRGGGLSIVWNGPNKIWANIPKGSLDHYMEEEGINVCEITVDMTEEFIECQDGSSYYKLDFTFGPTGAYFDPPLKLRMSGKYDSDSTEVWLYDENGEALDGQRHNGKGELLFYIPHFSQYYYDSYDY